MRTQKSQRPHSIELNHTMTDDIDIILDRFTHRWSCSWKINLPPRWINDVKQITCLLFLIKIKNKLIGQKWMSVFTKI